MDLGRSSTGSALSALWKTDSVFSVHAWASEAAPLLRAFAQVPWKRSARAMANFHWEVAAYHPLPPNHMCGNWSVREPRALRESGWAA
jgi:hypothetical protein